MLRSVNTITEQNFNPGLTLIGLSGTGPRVAEHEQKKNFELPV